jgi:hypothetical protein
MLFLTMWRSENLLFERAYIFELNSEAQKKARSATQIFNMMSRMIAFFNVIIRRATLTHHVIQHFIIRRVLCETAGPKKKAGVALWKFLYAYNKYIYIIIIVLKRCILPISL